MALLALQGMLERTTDIQPGINIKISQKSYFLIHCIIIVKKNLNILMNVKLKLSKLKVKSLECTKHYMRKIIMYENLNNCVC